MSPRRDMVTDLRQLKKVFYIAHCRRFSTLHRRFYLFYNSTQSPYLLL